MPTTWACLTSYGDISHAPLPASHLPRLAGQVGDAINAIATMREYAFYNEVASAEGAKLLDSLVTKAERRLALLRYFVDSLAMEPKSKLQDWTKRKAKLEAMEAKV